MYCGHLWLYGVIGYKVFLEKYPTLVIHCPIQCKNTFDPPKDRQLLLKDQYWCLVSIFYCHLRYVTA